MTHTPEQRFDPGPFPKGVTIGDKYGPAMKIETHEEADAYFLRCVEHGMGFGRLRPEAERIERQNLGYFAGYYDNATRERVERLFECAHPIFGKIAENGPPTPQEAFARGQRAAEGLAP